MTSYVRVSNRMVTCPYDESHRLKESKLQMHIAKCKLNHLDVEKKVCPFNAQHRIDPGQFDYHLIHCPNNDVVDKKAVSNTYKGFTGVPSYTQEIPIAAGECWDTEMSATAAPRYLPPRFPPNNGIVEPTPMSKPSERKRFYKGLHTMCRDLDNEKVPEAAASLTDTTNSIMKQPNIEAQNQFKAPEKSLLNIGLGRAAYSRIAANFSGPKPMPEPVLSHSDIANTISLLGTGRGRSNPASLPVLEDPEFPELGIGRGMRLHGMYSGKKKF